MILWKDRKRILGMPITFTVYSLSEDRLFIKTGLFNLRTEEIILYRIRDISLRRSFGQRIFGVGTVHICSSDHTCPELDVKNIRHSEKVKEIIHEQVEKMKLERRVRVNELIDGSDLNDPTTTSTKIWMPPLTRLRTTDTGNSMREASYIRRRGFVARACAVLLLLSLLALFACLCVGSAPYALREVWKALVRAWVAARRTPRRRWFSGAFACRVRCWPMWSARRWPFPER